MRITLIFLLSQWLGISAVSQTDTYWWGEFQYGDQSWDIGLLVETKEVGRIYSNALWSAYQIPDDFAIYDNEIRFELPQNLGSFKGKLTDLEISGNVYFNDLGDVEVPLVLKPSELPHIRRFDTVVQNGAISLGVSLLLPETSGSYPLAVILHGGGNSDRDAPPYYFLGDYLARNGIAALLYDKRGCGISGGDWRSVGFSQRAEDVLHILKWAENNQNEILQDRISLVAVSQGSWVAELVAKSHPGIYSMIQMVGPLVSPFEADTYALKSGLQTSGWPMDDIRERVYLWELLAEYIRYPQQEDEWKKLQEEIEKMSESNWFQAYPYTPNRSSWFVRWYPHIMDYDPMPVLQQLKIPILWIFGNRDSQSDFAENVAIINKMKRMGKPYHLLVIPDAGHGLMRPVDVYGEIQPPLASPQYLFTEVLKFLKKNR